MDNQFFERPILNSPYEEPREHWELDGQGQPTQRVLNARRPAAFITPIPKPRKRKTSQQELALDEVEGLSSTNQQYATASTINELRFQVENGAWHRIRPTGV
jgi:type III restriction enzyme